MGNSNSFQNEKEGKPVKEDAQVVLRVRIGIMCFDFVPCSHFVEIEGINGWVAYTSPMIVRCFVKNPERFLIDSKYMPELEIERPGADHFQLYNTANRQAIDPEQVIRIHKKMLETTPASLVCENNF